MKRNSAFIFHFLLMSMLLIGLAGGICGAATDSSVIRVGSELEFEPYAFVNDKGQPAGFSVDLIRAVADAMGLSITISSGKWDDVWTDLVEGRLDALPIVAKLSERTPLVDFSLPHTETYDSFFVREGDPIFQNIEGAFGKEIVVMRSDAAHHALMERNFQGRLILVDTIPEGLSLISSGKHDAFLCSKLIGVLAIKKYELEGISYGPTIQDYKRVFSFAVKKGDAELLEKLNQGLLIVKSSGEYQQIYNKWLRIDDPWLKFEKYFIPIILVVTAVVLIGGIWLFMLRRLVSKRTSELAEKNKQLRQATEGLEATVAERTAELLNANEMLKAEIFERAKSEEEKATLVHNMGERVKELQCLYSIAESIRKRRIVKEIFMDIVALIPAGWHYPDITRGKIHFEGQDYVTEPFEETEWMQASDILIKGKRSGSVEVYYLEERPELDEGPFLSEERNLIDGIARTLSEAIERKQAENERERLNIELARSNKELEQFAYIASHDLRSPLISISGYTDMLMHQYEDKLGKDAHEYIDFIQGSIKRMENLINGLLTYSRLGVSNKKFKLVDVNKVFVRAVANLTLDIEKNRAKITYDSLPVVFGNDVQMEQLLQNLIGNATKFSSDQPPKVHISAEQNYDEWVFSVKDNGIGIAAENREKIFNMFQCLDRNKYKGTGIGLAACKKIVELHGGKIWVESQLNTGSIFYFTMPITSSS